MLFVVEMVLHPRLEETEGVTASTYDFVVGGNAWKQPQVCVSLLMLKGG